VVTAASAGLPVAKDLTAVRVVTRLALETRREARIAVDTVLDAIWIVVMMNSEDNRTVDGRRW
jgi:hypothetical protein